MDLIGTIRIIAEVFRHGVITTLTVHEYILRLISIAETADAANTSRTALETLCVLFEVYFI